MCVTRERPGEARPDPVTKQGNWIFGHVAPGASKARPGSPSPPIRPLPWGRIPFPCPQDILAENVGWWWVNDKRCSHGTGEWHGRCCVCTMACDWKAGTDSRRAVGMRVAPLWWTNIGLRRRVATSCCNRRAGCCQLRLNRQVARCDRQPASLFDNNSAVYPAPNVCCLSLPYLQLQSVDLFLCLLLGFASSLPARGGQVRPIGWYVPPTHSSPSFREVSVEEGCAREGGLFSSPHLVRARYPFVAVRAYGLVPPGGIHTHTYARAHERGSGGA